MTNAPVPIQILQPYKSLLLASVAEDANLGELLSDCLDDLRQLLGLVADESELNDESDPGRIVYFQKSGSQSTQHRLVHAYLIYRLLKPVTWADSRELRDEEHHLVLLTRKRSTRCVAIYASEDSGRRTMRKAFGANGKPGFKHLSLVKPERLNSAFFGNTVRTLWMSGMHRRVPVKADAKVLSGVDLRFALDPINDQTFYFSAVRGHLESLDTNVGLSPKKSRIWTGPSSSWSDYIQGVSSLLERLGKAEATDELPLPILASIEQSSEGISDPYDMLIQPPELMTSVNQDTKERRELLEKWAYRGGFAIESREGDLGFDVCVSIDEQDIGTLGIAIDANEPGNVEIESVEIEAQTDGAEEELQEIQKICSSKSNLKVYYDSGHTLSDGSFFRVRFRDQPFSNWRWRDFGNDYNIKSEKPDGFPAEGARLEKPWNEEKPWSLFKWVFDEWKNGSLPWIDGEDRGWLASDDGSGEVADFIQFNPNGERPTISLIHVKAAANNSLGRQISVSKYEVVTAQAIKNTRYLDQQLLSKRLGEGVTSKVGKYVWKDGEISDRDSMIEALQSIEKRPKLRVVVVQPHIRKSSHTKAPGEDGDSANAVRLKQLDLILNQAQQACNGLGAEFLVISAKG